MKLSVQELKHATRFTNPFFFSRENLKYLGDSMSNYRVKLTDCGTMWELIRKKPARFGDISSAFFSINDYEQVWPNLSSAKSTAKDVDLSFVLSLPKSMRCKNDNQKF